MNLFLTACIPARLLLALVAYLNRENQAFMENYAILAYLIGISFLTLFVFDLRKTGAESTEEGNVIWWSKYRPVHAFMYALFAYLARHSPEDAWLVLLLDAILGLIIYVTHR